MTGRFGLGGWRLRTQMAIATTASAVAAVVLVWGGVSAYLAYFNTRWLSGLPPLARAAYDAIEARRAPDPAAMQALLTALGPAEREGPIGHALVLVACVVLGLLAAIGIGLGLARRLIGPLESVAEAARQVAAGRLEARARPHRPGSGEIGQLLADFNSMAEALESSERSMRASAAAIAHELRTPLTVLQGRLQGLADGVFQADARLIAGMRAQVETLARVVEDLRTLSLAAAGRLELRRTPVDLAAEVETVADAFAATLARDRLTLALDLRPAPVAADRERVRQAVAALIENVRRHAAEGGEVRIETWRAPGWARLAVLDRGAGWPTLEPGALFDAFRRGAASVQRAEEGSGLGLAVVAAIAEAHGGRVEAGARQGGGARVELFLPTEDV